jgi:hypothetical protein
MLLLIISIFFLLMPSVKVIYSGSKFSNTKSIDVFYSANDILKSYRVIAQLSCPDYDGDYVVKTLTKAGKKIGADGIIILGSEVPIDERGAVVNADALKYE